MLTENAKGALNRRRLFFVLLCGYYAVIFSVMFVKVLHGYSFYPLPSRVNYSLGKIFLIIFLCCIPFGFLVVMPSTTIKYLLGISPVQSWLQARAIKKVAMWLSSPVLTRGRGFGVIFIEATSHFKSFKITHMKLTLATRVHAQVGDIRSKPFDTEPIVVFDLPMELV